MIYLIYGTQPVKIKNRIKKVIKEFFGNEEVDQNSIYDLDLDTDTIFNVLDEINQFSLGQRYAFAEVLQSKTAPICAQSLKKPYRKAHFTSFSLGCMNIYVSLPEF